MIIHDTPLYIMGTYEFFSCVVRTGKLSAVNYGADATGAGSGLCFWSLVLVRMDPRGSRPKFRCTAIQVAVPDSYS